MTASETMLPLHDPAFLQDPYPVLAEIRERAPVIHDDATGQWFLTRYEDVHACLRDRRLGRTYEHRYSHEQFGRASPDPRWEEFRHHERWSLLQLEPPDHTRIRSLIARAFTPRSIADLRPFMELTATQLLAGTEPNGFDLLVDYAQPYSVAVICELLGVPRSDTRLLLDWSHAIVRMYELTTPDAEKHAANTAAAEFVSYARELLRARRAKSDNALVARLANATDDDHSQLSDDEIICTLIVLLNAGHEATVNTLGNGMRALLHHPAEWLRLVSGEVAATTAVEELIRFDPPLQLFERWVLEHDVTIAGRRIPFGAEIAMLFGSANRDPRHFHQPDRFDVGRGDASHVGFGGGIHFCIGAPLARLELDVSLAALVRAKPNLALLDEPRFNNAFVIHGVRELRVAG